MGILFYNGKFIDKLDNYNLIANRGFRYNDSFFETLHIVNQKVFNYKFHIKRFNRGIELLKFNYKYSNDELEHIIKEIIFRNSIKYGIARIYFFRDAEGLYYPQNNDYNILIETINKDKGFEFNNTQKLYIYNDEVKIKSKLSNIKSNTLISVLSLIEAKNRGYDNAIILNNEGSIIEAANANIFIVNENKIYTPPLHDGCIDGTMRRLIISLIPVNEISIKLEILQEAQEVFISNSISGIIPVKKVNNTSYLIQKTAKYIQKKIINLSEDCKVDLSK